MRARPATVPAPPIAARVVLSLLALLAGWALAQEEAATAAYHASMQPLNAQLAPGNVAGDVLLVVEGGELTITMAIAGLPPSMMHIQHLHGFPNGDAASCPDAGADANGDGFVDLLETEPATGTTLVPFNGAPAELEILSASYPSATADGLQVYRQNVALDELEAAVAETHGIDDVAFEDRTVFVHGVPEDAELPDSVASLPDVPAHVTVPLACGEFSAY